MINGGQILWNAIAICEMFKTSWQTGKLCVNEDLGEYRMCFDRGGEFGKETFWLLILKNYKRWTHQKFIPED